MAKVPHKFGSIHNFSSKSGLRVDAEKHHHLSRAEPDVPESPSATLDRFHRKFREEDVEAVAVTQAGDYNRKYNAMDGIVETLWSESGNFLLYPYLGV